MAGSTWTTGAAEASGAVEAAAPGATTGPTARMNRRNADPAGVDRACRRWGSSVSRRHSVGLGASPGGIAPGARPMSTKAMSSLPGRCACCCRTMLSAASPSSIAASSVEITPSVQATTRARSPTGNVRLCTVPRGPSRDDHRSVVCPLWSTVWPSRMITRSRVSPSQARLALASRRPVSSTVPATNIASLPYARCWSSAARMSAGTDSTIGQFATRSATSFESSRRYLVEGRGDLVAARTSCEPVGQLDGENLGSDVTEEGGADTVGHREAQPARLAPHRQVVLTRLTGLGAFARPVQTHPHVGRPSGDPQQRLPVERVGQQPEAIRNRDQRRKGRRRGRAPAPLVGGMPHGRRPFKRPASCRTS